MTTHDEAIRERGVEVLRRLSTSKVSLSDASFIAQWVTEARAALSSRRATADVTEELQAMLAADAPYSPRRYIYDTSPERRIWACDKLDEALATLQQAPE